MKKILSSFMICFSVAGFAQSFSLYKTDVNFIPTVTITNGSFIYESTAVNAVTITKLKLKNNAAVTQSFNVTRTIVSQSPILDLSAVANAPTTYFCFGNNCFTPPVSTPDPSDYTILLASGQTSTSFPTADNSTDNNQPFSIDLEEGAATGNYVVRYKVFNVANASDTISFYMGYNQPLGLKNYGEISELSIHLFPNPTKDNETIFINSTNLSSIKLSMTNSIGQLVYSNDHKLNIGTNSISLDCKNLVSGIYNVTIESQKGIQSKKLAIIQ
jgi:hypothetical protein